MVKILKEDEIKEEYKVASIEQVQRHLGVPREAKKITLLINEDEGLIINFYVRGATVHETQTFLETFLDQRPRREGGGIRLHWKEYYKAAWKRWIERSEPPISYRQLKYFSEDFNSVLGALFPNPLVIFGEGFFGVTEEEEKNLEDSSEEEED